MNDLRKMGCRALLISLLIFCGHANAAVLNADPAQSRINIVFKQLNVPIEAKFGKAVAQIVFDAIKPETSKANVDIDVTSFDLGDPEYNREVLKKEWFHALQFPRATFVSSAMKTSGPGSFLVAGKLTIKGKTVEVNFPLNVTKQKAGYLFEGTLPIKRLRFNIGEGEWSDTGAVADEVLIKFHIVATPLSH